MRIQTTLFAVGILVAAAFAAACGDSPTAPSTPAQTPVTTSFTGTLAAGGSQVQTFALASSGTVNVTLASLTTATGDVVDTSVSLAIGTASGSGCTPTSTVSASPALKAQLSPSLSSGNYCVRISDTGGITEPLGFAIRIVSFPITATADPNVVDALVTNLPVGGFAARTFFAAKGGTINVTLSSVSPSAALGIALGIDIGGGGCRLSKLVTADPGTEPQLSMPSDAGEYCVKVIDVGNLAALTRGTVPFTMTVAHP
jgi:hypothetical protein